MIVISDKGVYVAKKKSGEIYYRASITYKNKHISLGSFEESSKANEAYNYASYLVNGKQGIDDYIEDCPVSFDKYVLLINYRDNDIYLPNPIYIRKNYISYYLSSHEEMKFSVDDLFYYMSHKILRRGGHLYVNDYGMQISLRQKYGIKNYAVEGKDFLFCNGDSLDYRYENIEIINTYHGVERCVHNKQNCFKAKIHINGDVIVGYYDDAVKAAIAYNKAVDVLKKAGSNKNYPVNFVESISAKSYADIYSELSISKKLCVGMEAD